MLLIYAYIEEINPDVNSLLYDIFKLLLRKYLLLQATIIEAKDHKFYHFSKGEIALLYYDKYKEISSLDQKWALSPLLL
jgi:hypothetical protein